MASPSSFTQNDVEVLPIIKAKPEIDLVWNDKDPAERARIVYALKNLAVYLKTINFFEQSMANDVQTYMRKNAAEFDKCTAKLLKGKTTFFDKAAISKIDMQMKDKK